MSMLVGLAFMFSALAWAFAASGPTFKIEWQQFGLIVAFAICTGLGGGIFWEVGKDWLKSGVTGNSSAPVVPAKLANAPPASAPPASAPPVSPLAGSASAGSASATSTPAAPGGTNPPSISTEVGIALAGIVLAVVTGVYLVSMQNALQTGRELVKEMTAQRTQLERELAELAELRRQRQELTSGLTEMQEYCFHNIVAICEQLKAKENSGSVEADDFEKIINGMKKRIGDLIQIQKVDKILHNIRVKNFHSANEEAAQWLVFIENPHALPELIIVAIRPIRESLESLQKQRPRLFNKQSNYPNLEPLLDRLNSLEASKRW